MNRQRMRSVTPTSETGAAKDVQRKRIADNE